MQMERQPIIEERDVVGSESFLDWWNAWNVFTKSEAREKLNRLMEMTEMAELTGEMTQTEKLLSHFDGRLAPNHWFWRELAHTVQKGYPKGLTGGLLARMLHQFRYVIDAHLVRYIRTTYASVGGTDEDKLAAFARNVGDDSTEEPDRLHQKYYRDENNHRIFPGNSQGPNIKIVFHFHSEFILNPEGKFLYILDDSGDQNSIVNGASFNYADKREKGWRDLFQKESQHVRLDVNPVAPYDPAFRKRANVVDERTQKTYRAPSYRQYRETGMKHASEERKKSFKNRAHS